MFDLNKIIEYPGFTVPVPLGFIDESDSIGMPPIQQHQLKKTLMEDMVAKVSLAVSHLQPIFCFVCFNVSAGFRGVPHALLFLMFLC